MFEFLANQSEGVQFAASFIIGYSVTYTILRLILDFFFPDL